MLSLKEALLFTIKQHIFNDKKPSGVASDMFPLRQASKKKLPTLRKS